jgi:hypothetical protein
MKMTIKINDASYLIGIEGAIVGTHALNLERLIQSTNFIDLGISHLVFNFNMTTMIDSIAIEVINRAQKQGLRVSIINPKNFVKDMLDTAQINGRLLPLEENLMSYQMPGLPLSIEYPLSYEIV